MSHHRKPLKVGVRVPPCRPANELAAFAADVEAGGFDTMYVPDSQVLWRDSYLTLFAAALRTSRLGLGTAVSNVVTRHPSVVASLTRTVAEVAPGRFFLGLGVGNSSVEPVGLTPSTRAELRQGIDQVRGLLAGETVDFAGVGARMRDPHGPVAIHVGATGPRNLRFTGEVADGAILLSGVAPDLLTRAVSLVHDGARSAGRDPEELEEIGRAHV
jgi:5,10-methylenetetrahydromethanopterin reductase